MRRRISAILFSSAAALMLGVTTAAKGQVLIGGFQGASDPTDTGWIDTYNSDAITSDPLSTFPSGVVPGYAQSLQMAAGTTGFGNPSFKLDFSSAQIAAFNANSWLTFTISIQPGTASGGYYQLYNLAYNTGGSGYNNFCSGSSWATYSQSSGNTNNNQTGEPNWYFPYSGNPSVLTEVVTVNYSSLLTPTFIAGESYLQWTWQFNQSVTGASTTTLPILVNNVELSPLAFGAVPEPASLSLVGLGAMGLMARRRRRA